VLDKFLYAHVRLPLRIFHAEKHTLTCRKSYATRAHVTSEER